jgi:putative transposase
MLTRKAYTTDLTDAQWSLIEGGFPVRPPGSRGRPREIAYREIVNAILYLLDTGCQWRNLPHDLPCYTTVSDYYHTWRKNGLLERMQASLRRSLRLQAGKEAQPSVLILDSQSVKTSAKGGAANLPTLSALTRESASKAASAMSR